VYSLRAPAGTAMLPCQFGASHRLNLPVKKKAEEVSPFCLMGRAGDRLRQRGNLGPMLPLVRRPTVAPNSALKRAALLAIGA
jgi:hypothetical protein